MARLYIGNLDPRVNERDIEGEFRTFGVIKRSYSPRGRSPPLRNRSPAYANGN